MSDLTITALLIGALFLILASGVWIGLTLSGVAWIGMQLFSSRPAGDAMAVTIWGSSSSWTLTALPLFIWMGEILFRTRLSKDMFRGLAPWMQVLPGRLLHVNVVGCAIFAAVSGSSAATCATIGKMSLPELNRRGYPDIMSIGSLAGAGTLGLLIPPSIIMIVYGVSADVSISQLFIGGVIPGILLAALFSAYIALWSLLNPKLIPPADAPMTFTQKLSESRNLIPVVLLIAAVLGSIYTGIATATEAAGLGVVGSLVLSAVQGSLSWATFKDSLMGGTRLYCMIALILAGAGTLGLLIPPSIIMIVYGVTADVSISQLFIGGVIPGILLAAIFSAYIAGWSLLNPTLIPPADAPMNFQQKLSESRNLIPVVLLIAAVLGSIYTGIATATEAAGLGVVGSLVLSAVQGSLNWATFKDSLMGGTRLYCMIALILAGAAFLTLSMGYIGLPRHLAEWIATLGLSKFQLILALTAFYVVLGCFLDGISMVVLTMGVIMPTVQKAGIDPLWFGIFIVIVVEMAQVTPPVGFNLFVMQGMTGRSILYIARAAFPFFLLMVGMVVLLYAFPQIVTFLPQQMKG